MAKGKITNSTGLSKIRPAESVEGRERQLCALAVDRAEEMLRNGTASSQIICHYLKLASSFSELEKEKIRADIAEKQAKAKKIEADQASEEKYDRVINALKEYQGHGTPEDYYYDDDEPFY